MSKYRPIWIRYEGPRPAQINERDEIIDGQHVKVRVFDPAGCKEGMRRPKFSGKFHGSVAAAISAAEDRSARYLVSKHLKRRNPPARRPNHA